MLWIVQDNLFIENKRGALMDALDRLSVPFIRVNVSAGQIDQDIENESVPIITNGSVMLSQIARDRGWRPGSLLNDNFSYDVWAPHYSDLMLNKDAIYSTLGTCPDVSERMFVRPLSDMKTFNGKVFEREEFLTLQKASLAGEKSAPHPTTPILCAPAKRVGQEHRHFIVEGEIVTSSRYKLAGLPNFREGADQAVLDVVKHAIDIWQPAQAFVLDTYISGDDIGIVEIGCLTHAGLYEADLVKLVDRIDGMRVMPEHKPIGKAGM